MSADPSVSADAQVRRRIVSAPRRTVAPIAVVTRDPQAVSELVEKLKLTRPVVTFPSLAHFCTERQRAERWAGIVIGQACAWDARLDDFVVHRDCIALHGEEEGYGWPDAVYRFHTGDVDAWLTSLDAPREKVPVVRTREKRPPREGEPRAKRSRAVFSLWSPDRVVTVEGASGESVAPSTPSESPKAPTTVVTRTVREPSKPRVPQQQTLPFVQEPAKKPSGKESPSKAPPARTEPARVDTTAQRAAADREVAKFCRAREKQHRAAMLRSEEKLMRLAAEIGFVKARGLLDRVRARALDMAR